jgi:hypothetical protein
VRLPPLGPGTVQTAGFSKGELASLVELGRETILVTTIGLGVRRRGRERQPAGHAADLGPRPAMNRAKGA